MPNSSPQAVAFANNRIRPAADALYSIYLTAQKVTQEWNGQTVSAVIPNDANLLVDGSAVDGRPPMTNAQATNIITRLGEILTLLDGTGALAQTAGRLGTVTAVQCNGHATV
jgi:hypothetical protein